MLETADCWEITYDGWANNMSTEIDSNTNPELNQKLAEVYRVDGSFRIEDFSYTNDALTDVIFNEVERTSFDGVTVSSIQFGITVSNVYIYPTCNTGASIVQ